MDVSVMMSSTFHTLRVLDAQIYGTGGGCVRSRHACPPVISADRPQVEVLYVYTFTTITTTTTITITNFSAWC